MAGFSERVSVLIDVVTDGANAGLGKFKSAIGEAEGFTGKFKAGASAAFDGVKANAGLMAAGAATAFAGFALKGIEAFTSTAKAALDLGTATGLSTEEASRWIAVGDDYQVSAEGLQGALGKIGKTLDSTKWDEYGIATRDAGGNARSTNDIFLDALDTLGGITNETERARVGNELFGKGYAAIAPLVGKTRDEYKSMLDTVSGGQVITDQEAKKAEKMRLAQDALSDAFKDLEIAVGEMVAAVAPELEVVAKGVGLLATAVGKFQGTGFNDVIKNTGELSEQAQKLGINVKDVAAAVAAQGGSFEDMAPALQNAIDQKRQHIAADIAAADAARGLTKDERDDKEALDESAASHQTLAKDVRDDMEAHASLAASARDLKAAYDELLGRLNAREAWLNLEDAIDDQNAKMLDSAATDREKEQSTIEVQKKLIDYLGTLEGVPAQKQTDILALIDAGKWNEANAAMAELTKTRTISVNVNMPIIPKSGAYATGTGKAGTQGGTALVGEKGPELATFPQGTSISSASRTKALLAQGGGSTYIDNRRTFINVQSINADSIAKLVNQHDRLNGPYVGPIRT